jgi:glycosyltransferase 2 family protein
MSRKPSKLKPLLTLARYGLLALALIYLVMNVHWHDRISLKTGPGDADKEAVRLVIHDEAAGTLVVIRDGEEITLPIDRAVISATAGIPEIKPGLKTAVRQLDLSQALWALVIFAPVPLLAAVRLVWMLMIQNVHIGYWNSVKLTYAGTFFNFALPGTTGGDLVKAYYLTQYTHHKTEAVTTVFFDRVVGLVGVFTVATAMMLVKWNTSPVDMTTYLILPVIAFSGLGVFALLIFSPGVRRLLRLRTLADRLPFASHVVRVGAALGRMGKRRRLLGYAYVLTLALQFLVFYSAFVMSQALQMDGSVVHYLIFVPIGFMIAAIPISPPQAFGVMEAAFIEFFTGPELANSASQAVTLALLLRLTQLVWALPGMLVPLFGAHLPRRDELDEMEETLEHEFEEPVNHDEDPAPTPRAAGEPS